MMSMSAEKHRAEVLRLVIQNEIGPGLMADHQVHADVVFDQVFGQMVAKLRWSILGCGTKEIEVAHAFSVPATWWEHFKRDVVGRRWRWKWLKRLSAWALRRWPVKMTTQTQTTTVYADAVFQGVAVPPGARCVYFLKAVETRVIP